MSESVYDKEVAPLLKQAGEICERHGMPFVAQVEYQPGDFGQTAFLGENPSIAMRLLLWAALAKGNLDQLFFAAARHGKEHGHDSIVLARLAAKPAGSDEMNPEPVTQKER